MLVRLAVCAGFPGEPISRGTARSRVTVRELWLDEGGISMAVRKIIGCAALGVSLVLAGCTGGTEPRPESSAPVLAPGKPGEQARTLSPEEISSARQHPRVSESDVRYVRMMIVHHEQALTMTDLVGDRAQGAQVRGLAARIAESQGPEIQAMTTWLRRNGHDPHAGHQSHTAHAGMPGMASTEQLDTLRTASGKDFDQVFLRLMITHHEGALTMAREVLRTGSDVLVEEMAQGVIATQTKEIARMNALLAS